ncbi:MAG: hypothetical protein ACTHKC_05965 [Candidatus Nitrosocosmicus sp.]
MTSLSLFIFATIGFTYICLNEVMAQANTTTSSNQTSGNTTGANQTETLKQFEKLTGSDQNIISKDRSISNPNNTLGNSLSTNQFQSY